MRLCHSSIFENEAPPSNIAEGASFIRSTGAWRGRTGFIPIDETGSGTMALRKWKCLLSSSYCGPVRIGMPFPPVASAKLSPSKVRFVAPNLGTHVTATGREHQCGSSSSRHWPRFDAVICDQPA